MTSELLIALLSLFGTLGGSAMGAIAWGKLTGYRLRELEKKVDEHNNYARRMPVLEGYVHFCYAASPHRDIPMNWKEKRSRRTFCIS